jgi:hypothetical protein
MYERCPDRGLRVWFFERSETSSGVLDSVGGWVAFHADDVRCCEHSDVISGPTLFAMDLRDPFSIFGSFRAICALHFFHHAFAVVSSKAMEKDMVAAATPRQAPPALRGQQSI